MGVAFAAAQLELVVRVRPEVMIARYPYDDREPPAQRPQCPFDVGNALAYVASHKEPVRRRFRPQIRDNLPILWKRNMEVAETQQPGCRHAARRRWSGYHIYEAYPTAGLRKRNMFTRTNAG